METSQFLCNTNRKCAQVQDRGVNRISYAIKETQRHQFKAAGVWPSKPLVSAAGSNKQISFLCSALPKIFSRRNKKKNNLKPLQCVRDDFHLKTSEIQYVTKENVLWREKNHSNITLHLGKKPTLTNILAEEQRTYWCKQNTLGLLPLQQLFPINYIKQNPFLSREDRLQCHLESAAHTVLLFGH